MLVAFALLVFLLICHYLADFTHMSTPWMLAAKRYGKPLLPIAAHGFMHAWLMAGIILIFTDFQKAIYAFLFELITHTLIDTAKGRISAEFPYLQNPSNIYYWYLYGFDQLLHLLVIVTIVFTVITL